MIRTAKLISTICGLSLLVRCGIDTQPMHSPIYPESGKDVTYSLSAKGDGGIKHIKLYHTIVSANAALTAQSTNEELLLDTSLTGTPSVVNIAFTKVGGYSAGDEVKYRFEVRTWWGQTRSHEVTFAIQPYSRRTFAPIYVQGDPDHVADIVFIPDEDIQSTQEFYDNCSMMITRVFFAEPTVKKWSRQLNFYVNHYTGKATDYDNITTEGYHQEPENWADVSFAEMKVILHDRELRDYTYNLYQSLCSAEQEYSGTMRHEAGHALFGLSDEYGPGGYHTQEDILPNNWGFPAISDMATAQDEAKNAAIKASVSRHKTPFDVQLISMGSRWCKICNASCQMRHSGAEVQNYDAPCADRVVHCIKENAYNIQNGGE
jgi:hypothetical protein